MERSTKHYSSEQERIIAKYLGWKTVPASGAREFDKGDIISEDFIAECKTHTSVGHRIKFDFRVWKKLNNEAMSCMRTPVLFVDDGSQTIEGTWAAIHAKSIPLSSELPLKSGDKAFLNSQSISFPYQSADNEVWIFNVPNSKDKLAIMPLRTFRLMFTVG